MTATSLVNDCKPSIKAHSFLSGGVKGGMEESKIAEREIQKYIGRHLPIDDGKEIGKHLHKISLAIFIFHLVHKLFSIWPAFWPLAAHYLDP